MHDFAGPNAGYVLELYERYQRDPLSVDPASRAYFANWEKTQEAGPPSQTSADLHSAIASVNYVQAIRTFGHLAAHVDPLESPPPGDPSLELSSYSLTEDELRRLPASIVGGPVAERAEDALQVIQELREIYESTIGYEYGHIRVSDERDWLRESAESGRFRPPRNPVDLPSILERLTEVEAFEQFIHRRFPGKTRFSIEGLDLLVPVLDEIIGCAADSGTCMIMLGMSHRGRLNVLAHVLRMPYHQILSEFRDRHERSGGIEQLGWTGDVTYHKGGFYPLKSGEEVRLVISLAPNPSHLEHVNPVLEGMARSAGSKTDQPGEPVFFPLAALPILIHGDGAFPAEGIAAETLNFSKLPGYETGGTIHIIANNQLGYTTPPEQGRSTQYASDLAKGFEIPIMHVNADDPVAVIEASRTAYAYREKFGKDFLIDLIGYRRYGHNEGDEPSFTQPLLYQEIEKHPTARKILAEKLAAQGVIEPSQADRLIEEHMDALQTVLDQLKSDEEIQPPIRSALIAEDFQPKKSEVTISTLQEYNEALLTFPEGFSVNRKLDRPLQRRRKAFDNPDEKTVDWGAAEELSFATILAAGIPIRFTGQDSERGTFSQRHAVFHDIQSDKKYTPLQAFRYAKAAFEIRNSPLSESAAIGFEFGFSTLFPSRMVLWEAQYGDFINSAQVIIDEFVASAQAKWEQKPSLILLLPHGYEGAGPDHSSARLERFLNIATPSSMRIANATTAAQYYHLLRLQAASLTDAPLPLVVFTPKSLLRHPLVASSPRDLAEGEWQPVLDDSAISARENVRRILFCTGKIAVDLAGNALREKHPDVAIIRVEQLVPFPAESIRAILDRYSHLDEIAWAQEEPENMGAWSYVQPRIEQLIQGRLPLKYIGRAISSSPAEGSASWHAINQATLVGLALSQEMKEVSEGTIVHKGS